MHLSHQQEQYSLAFIRAVVAAAGFRFQEGPKPDDDSVDLTITGRGPMGSVRSPKLDVQLKCQLGRPTKKPSWPYALKVKNYDDLRPTDVQVPRILVVVAVPEEPPLWTEQKKELHLAIRHCAWWVSLRGLPETTSTTTQRVQIPRAQVFDAAALVDIMGRIGQGEAP